MKKKILTIGLILVVLVIIFACGCVERKPEIVDFFPKNDEVINGFKVTKVERMWTAKYSTEGLHISGVSKDLGANMGLGGLKFTNEEDAQKYINEQYNFEQRNPYSYGIKKITINEWEGYVTSKGIYETYVVRRDVYTLDVAVYHQSRETARDLAYSLIKSVIERYNGEVK
jgi:hypothetical protein